MKSVLGIETICFLTQGYNGRTRRLEISGGFVDFELEVVEPHSVLNACRLAPALVGILAAKALAFEGLDRFVLGSRMLSRTGSWSAVVIPAPGH